MSEPYIGEIRMFAGNFAPRGWSFCVGQLLAISQNDALFSLLGTIYGGDGSTTFGLPDLRGRVPVHAGSGPGLSPRQLGSKFGAEQVTLNANQLPSHKHQVSANNSVGNKKNAGSHVAAGSVARVYSNEYASPTDYLSNTTISNSGGGQSHTNMMPFQCVNYIIALVGIYPSRH
ncbi:phage tail protein [Draconibacterium halophilum]|uniref:Phage tail protein n=1 Tax=Draconibacterium halophilum TaxID=2706887 RepID=A0A6C0RED1_9BACT|nr:tail fiber protein [Draconibacterium halophilum]QIA08489.1 phage tail protein [Draconibacterium halophilum]